MLQSSGAFFKIIIITKYVTVDQCDEHLLLLLLAPLTPGGVVGAPY